MNHFLQTVERLSICISLLVNAQLIVAQTVIETKYANGQPKIRLHIQQNDTFCVEKLFENGQLYSIHWHDSTHYFYPNQIIAKTERGKFPTFTQWLFRFEPQKINFFGDLHYSLMEDSDSTDTYFPNGQLHERIRWQKNHSLKYEIYLLDGSLSTTYLFEKQNNYTYNYLKINGVDTIQWLVDTIAKTHTHIQSKQQHVYLREKYHYEAEQNDYRELTLKIMERVLYDSTGKITFSWSEDLPQLHVDKDNGLCLYGFRNAQDEWVIPPKYESIQLFNNVYYLVNENNKYGILDQYGKIIIPIEWSFLELLRQEPAYRRRNEEDVPNHSNPPVATVLLICQKKGLYGVIDGFGKIILKPAYQEIRFYKNNLYEVKIAQKWGIVNADGKIIVAPQYDKTKFTLYPDLFIVADSMDDSPNEKILKYGLVNAAGKTLIPATFEYAFDMDTAYNRCFVVQTWSYPYYYGLFHAEKGWILDPKTVHSTAENSESHALEKYKILYKEGASSAWQDNRFGLLEATTPVPTILLPFDYQEITYSIKKNYFFGNNPTHVNHYYRSDTLFHCKKAGKAGIFDPRTRKWLLPLIYDEIYNFGDSLYFVSHDKKWQFINPRGQRVLRETFNAGGTFSIKNPFDEADDRKTICYAVRNDTMFFYNETSFPMKTHLEDVRKGIPQNSYINSSENWLMIGGWYLNSAAKVLFPPEYEMIYRNDRGYVIRHWVSKKQYWVDNEGNKQSFLSEYDIRTMNLAQNWVLVQDTLTQQLGMMTADQKQMLPTKFFGMASPDEHGLIWARRDVAQLTIDKYPYIQISVSSKELNPLDSNWQIYDRTGRLLTNIVFDYPFKWANQQLGIGQVRGKQGLWNTRGQNVLPANYDKIWYDTSSHIFHIFQKQTDGAVKTGFANNEGQLVIDANLLNMSPFMGQGAFVETAEGFGIIQKNGPYFVSPRPYALQQALFPIRKWVEYDTMRTVEDFKFTAPYRDNVSVKAHLDTAKFSIQRFQIENLYLEQMINSYFLDSEKAGFQRIEQFFFSKTRVPVFWKQVLEDRYPFQIRKWIQQIHCNSKALCFTKDWQEDKTYTHKNSYHRFQLKNNIWIDTPLDSILFWNKTTEMALNGLLFQKISALKNQAMDCGNPAAYMERVKDKFYILQTGLQFFMPRHQEDEVESIPILLTWAELKPYLR